jgi:hypothetical protein
MKYTIQFNKKASEKLYDQVYKTLDLVFGYALSGYALRDGDKDGEYVLESDDDAECELDRILDDVEDIFDTCLLYEAGDDGDEEDEEADND